MRLLSMNATDQLCVITDEISQDFEHALKIASEFKIKAVDLRTIWNKNIALFIDEDLERLEEILKKYDMKVAVITGPFAKCVLPDSRLATNKKKNLARNPQYNMSLFERIAEISDYFKTPYVRIFSFLRGGGEIKEKNWKKMMELLRPYIEKAEKLGKILLVENDYGYHAGKLKDTRRFFEEINSDHVKMVLDPGNFYVEKERITPEAFEYFYDRDLVVHMHVKDPKRTLFSYLGFFTVVGEGKINYKPLFKQALEHGYKGYFSLETHSLRSKEKVSRKSLENMSKMLKELS